MYDFMYELMLVRMMLRAIPKFIESSASHYMEQYCHLLIDNDEPELAQDTFDVKKLKEDFMKSIHPYLNSLTKAISNELENQLNIKKMLNPFETLCKQISVESENSEDTYLSEESKKIKKKIDTVIQSSSLKKPLLYATFKNIEIFNERYVSDYISTVAIYLCIYIKVSILTTLHSVPSYKEETDTENEYVEKAKQIANSSLENIHETMQAFSTQLISQLKSNVLFDKINSKRTDQLKELETIISEKGMLASIVNELRPATKEEKIEKKNNLLGRLSFFSTSNDSEADENLSISKNSYNLG